MNTNEIIEKIKKAVAFYYTFNAYTSNSDVRTQELEEIRKFLDGKIIN